MIFLGVMFKLDRWQKYQTPNLEFTLCLQGFSDRSRRLNTHSVSLHPESL